MIPVAPSGFLMCEPDEHRQLHSEQPGPAVQAHQPPYNCESVCRKRGTKLHENQVFLCKLLRNYCEEIFWSFAGFFLDLELLFCQFF